MGKLLVDRETIRKIRNGYRLGSGIEGSSYLSEDNRCVIKLFHIYDRKRKIYFDGLESGLISFPNDVLIDSLSNDIAGYTMDYMIGEPFIFGFYPKITLEDLKMAYTKTLEEIEKYPNICMDDNCLANMLFNYRDKKINLIDTGRWYPKENSTSKNVENYDWQMMTALCRGNLEWMSYPLNQVPILHELYRTYKFGNEILFIDFLNALKEEVEKRQKVETIEDLILVKRR